MPDYTDKLQRLGLDDMTDDCLEQLAAYVEAIRDNRKWLEVKPLIDNFLR